MLDLRDTWMEEFNISFSLFTRTSHSRQQRQQTRSMVRSASVGHLSCLIEERLLLISGGDGDSSNTFRRQGTFPSVEESHPEPSYRLAPCTFHGASLEQPNADCKRVVKMEEEPDGRSPQNVSSIWTLMGGNPVCFEPC